MYETFTMAALYVVGGSGRGLLDSFCICLGWVGNFSTLLYKIVHQIMILENNTQTIQLLHENMHQEQLWYFSAQSSCCFVKLNSQRDRTIVY